MKLKTIKPGRMYPATNLAPHISRDTGRDPRLAVREKHFLYIKGRTNKKPHGVVAHSIRQADRNQQTIAFCLLYYTTNKGAEQHQKQKKGCLPMKSDIFKCSSIFDKNFLTVQDVSSYLNISSGHAYQLAHRRDFPAMYVGSTIRIPTAPFLAWVEQRCRITKDLDAYLSKRIAESGVHTNAG